MFRCLVVLLMATSALAMDAAYQPHRVLISSGKGFATHAVLLGGEPRPHHGAYPDLAASTDRVDKFAFNLYWKENPPLTTTEAARLKVLEAANVRTAEMVYLQTKASKFINQPVELDMQVQLILAVAGDYSSTWVSLEKYELMADCANALAPEPPYFPGLAINHEPIFMSVNDKTVSQLARSWRSRWQPVFLRGSGRGPAGVPMDITLKFRRHQSVLMALGTLNSRDGKFSVLANASYNRQAACDLPTLDNPPWTNYYNSTWTNWTGGYAIDFSQFKLTYANYGVTPFDPALPDYNRDGDPLPCPACPPCTKAHVEDNPCPEPTPCPPCPLQHVTATIEAAPTPAPTEKGNNGLGNGIDPAPPGNPKENDGTGTSPGNPGNKK